MNNNTNEVNKNASLGAKQVLNNNSRDEDTDWANFLVPVYTDEELDRMESPQPLLTDPVGGAWLLEKKAINVLTGLPKSCKSTFIALVVAKLISEGKKVCVIDTGERIIGLRTLVSRISASLKRKLTLTAVDEANLLLYDPTEKTAARLRQDIRVIAETKKPDLIVIDDIIYSALPDNASTKEDAQAELKNILLDITQRRQLTTILTVVPTPRYNPSSMLGFVGSWIERGAALVLELVKSGDVVTLKYHNNYVRHYHPKKDGLIAKLRLTEKNAPHFSNELVTILQWENTTEQQ